MNTVDIIERYLKCKKENRKLLEQDTKNAFINPLLQELGYDLSDIFVITSEYKTFKNDSVDYAILKDGEPYIFVEAKKMDEKLNSHSTQLRKYFNMEVTAKFGILSNGIDYEIYADIKHENVMDDKPFLSFSLMDSDYTSLNKFADIFKLSNLNNIANDVNAYLNEIALNDIFDNYISNISKDFLNFLNSLTDRKIGKEDVEKYFQNIKNKDIEEIEIDENTVYIEDNYIVTQIQPKNLNDEYEELMDISVNEKLDLLNPQSIVQLAKEGLGDKIQIKDYNNKNLIKENQISFMGNIDGDNVSDIIYTRKDKMICELIINELTYYHNSWYNAYTHFIEYILDNYNVDLSKYLTYYFKEISDIPDYLQANKSYEKLSNGDFLSTNLSIECIIEGTRHICETIGLTFEVKDKK